MWRSGRALPWAAPLLCLPLCLAACGPLVCFDILIFNRIIECLRAVKGGSARAGGEVGQSGRTEEEYFKPQAGQASIPTAWLMGVMSLAWIVSIPKRDKPVSRRYPL